MTAVQKRSERARDEGKGGARAPGERRKTKSRDGAISHCRAELLAPSSSPSALTSRHCRRRERSSEELVGLADLGREGLVARRGVEGDAARTQRAGVHDERMGMNREFRRARRSAPTPCRRAAHPLPPAPIRTRKLRWETRPVLPLPPTHKVYFMCSSTSMIAAWLPQR
jgi:hypothetical protein